MKILYIDNRRYGYNADLHVKFFSYMSKNSEHKIIGYGNNLSKHLDISISPSEHNVEKDFNRVLKYHKPDVILTYNSNGSSYEAGLDNISLYKWISEPLSKVDIPKFHITTDYCRSGFKKEQAQWFKDIGYSASIFRHKISLEHPSYVDKYWLPFSVDRKLYNMHSEKNISKKSELVAFIGAAHNSSHSLYANRIAAIDFLNKHKLMKMSKVVDKDKGRREVITGLGYVKFLSSSLFGLTCGGSCNFTIAKYFQIPAAYSMLVCAPTDGIEDFPKDTYILYTKETLDNLLFQIKDAIANKKQTKDKIMTLNEHIMKHHNHDVRIKQLIKIFNKHIK